MNNNQKRKNRRKRIIIAYALRAAVMLVIALMLFLMFCGCLYIRDFFRERSDKDLQTVHAGQISGVSENLGTDEVPKQDTKEDVPTVMLDAGHGGNDGGTVYGKVNEKDITLAVALELKSRLEQEGVKVLLTRGEDEYLSLEERAEAANSSPASLFVSLHCNYYEDDFSISGLECYYLEESEKGGKLAQTIVDAIEGDSSIKCRGTRTEDFYVLKRTSIPAVLIELGFLSNKAERQKLGSDDYQAVLAQRISEGILNALKEQ